MGNHKAITAITAIISFDDAVFIAVAVEGSNRQCRIALRIASLQIGGIGWTTRIDGAMVDRLEDLAWATEELQAWQKLLEVPVDGGGALYGHFLDHDLVIRITRN